MARTATARKAASSSIPAETIKGSIARTRFHNQTNGYCVIGVLTTLDDARGPEVITAVGCLPSIREGDEYSFTGAWKDDAKWGRQFKFDSHELIMPTTTKGLADYLSTLTYGVGHKKALAIVEALGEDQLFERILLNPAALADIPGVHITAVQAVEIGQKLAENTVLAELSSMICREGITPRLAAQVYNKYGPKSLEVVRENPYVLAGDMYGVGFKTADKIAQATGLKSDSPYRVQAAIEYAIKAAQDDGHCYLRPRDIVEALTGGDTRGSNTSIGVSIGGKYGLLGQNAGVGINEIAAANGELMRLDRCVREGSAVYLPGLAKAEKDVARHVRRLMGAGSSAGGSVDISPEQIEEALNAARGAGRSGYHERQEAAIREGLRSSVSVLTGGPGTGKTEITNGLLAAYQHLHSSDKQIPYIYLGSPTGRAAKRLSEATGHEALTLHRLLGYRPEVGFVYGEDCPLSGPGLAIIDESSMIDISMAASLLSAIPNDLQVVFVGDVAQLPSVGPGSFLRDLILSGVVPVTRLTYNFRQAQGSQIAACAAQIDEGIVPDVFRGSCGVHGDVEFVALESPEDAAGEVERIIRQAVADGYGAMDFQILAPMRKTSSGVTALNNVVRRIVNPLGPGEVDDPKSGVGREKLRVGDKVMVTSNDYSRDVYNGDLGIVARRADRDDVNGAGIVVEIDGRHVHFDYDAIGELQLAYASSIHKCVTLDTLIETDEGLIRIGDAERGRVATINGKEEYTRTPDQPEQVMLCITTKDGYRVTVTPDHGLDSWDGQQYCRVNAQDLKVGDWLQIGMGVRIDPSATPALPRPTNGARQERTLTVPTALSEDLTEFFGLMVADGCNYERGIRLAKRHKEVTDRFASLCSSLFGYDPKRYKKGGIFYAEVSSKFISRWLSQIGGMEPNRKAVPECVLGGTSRHHRAFLRGLFEDASVNTRLNGGEVVDHIDFTTCKEKLASDIQVMLARLGIVAKHTRNSGKRSYSKLYIFGEYARKFGETIGFVANEKQRRTMLPTGKQIRYRIPVSYSETTILHHTYENDFTLFDRNNARERGYISRDTARGVLMDYCAPEWLRERCLNHHDRIASIERVSAISTCLNVPEGHQFLQNGISGWNSQGSEYPLCLCILTRSHWIMLQRNLIYTGATRAKHRLVVIAQEDAVKQAVKNDKIQERYSMLRERLQTALTEGAVSGE